MNECYCCFEGLRFMKIMKLAALVVLVLVSSHIPQVLSRPKGAPAAACSSLTPSHSPNSPQTSSIPYSVDLRAFHVDRNGLISYTPNMTYALTLSAPGGRPMFQGFLIQARLVTDETVVGSFSPEVFPPGVRLCSCNPAESTITHSDNTNKSSVSAIWTAPSNNKGTIYFAFAVVQQYDTFWADQRTAMIHGGFQYWKMQTNFSEEERRGKPRQKRQIGVQLMFQGETVANHSFLTRGQIHTADEDTVMCVTQHRTCCSSDETGDGGVGNWFFPNGSVVPSSSEGTRFYMTRGPQVVRLHRRRGGVSGIYHCSVPDASGENHVLFVGLYTTVTGRPDITSIDFTLTSELNAQTPIFTLTCISEGGPVERVAWRRGWSILQDDSTYDISGPTVVDAESAIYHHTLTVTGRLPGMYECRKFSIRPHSAGESYISTMNIHVVAADPPTIVSAEQVGPTTTVRVTWTPPTRGATVTGYRIYYTGGFRDVGNGGATEDTFSLQYGTYTIAMVALSQHLPSALSNSVTVDIAAPVITLAQPASSTSISVVWTRQGDVDSFEISFERVTGAMQQGPCPSVEDNGTVTVNNGTARQQIVMGLEEFSTYSFTITAIEGGRMSLPSGSMTATTEQTAPSSTPESVRAVAVTSTSITVAWDPVSCIDRNSEIISYEVHYSGLHLTVPGTGDAGGMYTISPLTPFTSYSIQVAAVNNGDQTGEISDAIIVETEQDVPSQVRNLQAIPNLFSIDVSWSAPAVPNGIITAYEVHYQQQGEQEREFQNTSMTSTELTGLRPETNYAFSVRAYTIAGAGEEENIIVTTTTIIGVRLMFQGETVANHGFLLRGPIRTADEDTVMCVTDNTACCSSDETGDGGVGNWFFPNGSVVHSENGGTRFYETRGLQVVRLHRRRGGVSGIYHCRIPDASGENHDLYVGLYTIITGRPVITSIDFTLTSELNAQTPTFTLTCISERGPVERVKWSRGGSSLQDGSTYGISGPTVVDAESAIYPHTLTVTGRLPGLYECRKFSIRPHSAGESYNSTMNIHVVAANPPTIVGAEQVRSTTAVRVTWIPLTGAATVTGYRIYYTGGFRDVRNGGATEDTLTLQYRTYTITMVALSQHLPSALSNSVTVTVAQQPPSGPPVNFEVTVEGSRDLTFSWDPPAEDLRNGVIAGYQLSCSPQPNGLPRTFNQTDFNSGGGVEVRLSGFAPITTYNCSVLASTSAGSGPADNREVTTEDDSMLFQLQLTGIHSCVQWVLQDTAAKLQDIQNAVRGNIERLCQCGFSEEHIPETESVPIFQCFSDTAKATFRARLVGTAQATSSELIADIEQWIADGATINVQRVVLELDSTCQPVAITAVSDPQCLDPAGTGEPTATTDSTITGADIPYAAIVGGVVAMIIVTVLAIVVVVIVILVLKNRKSELQFKQEGNSKGGAVELTTIGDTKGIEYDISNFQNMTYETTVHQSCTAEVPTTVNAKGFQDHEYDIVGRPSVVPFTAPENDDCEEHVYNYI